MRQKEEKLKKTYYWADYWCGKGAQFHKGRSKKPCRMSPRPEAGDSPLTPTPTGWGLPLRVLTFLHRGQEAAGEILEEFLCSGEFLAMCRCCLHSCIEAKWDMGIWHGHSKHCHRKSRLWDVRCGDRRHALGLGLILLRLTYLIRSKP